MNSLKLILAVTLTLGLVGCATVPVDTDGDGVADDTRFEVGGISQSEAAVAAQGIGTLVGIPLETLVPSIFGLLAAGYGVNERRKKVKEGERAEFLSRSVTQVSQAIADAKVHNTAAWEALMDRLEREADTDVKADLRNRGVKRG